MRKLKKAATTQKPEPYTSTAKALDIRPAAATAAGQKCTQTNKNCRPVELASELESVQDVRAGVMWSWYALLEDIDVPGSNELYNRVGSAR